MKAQSIKDFIERMEIEYQLKDAQFLIDDEAENYKLSNSDCLFTWSAAKGDMVYRSGFKNLLGYDDDILTLERFVSLIHPEDVEYVKLIGQAATLESLERPEGNREWMLYVSHRIKKVDGSYIQVVAQSRPYRLDKKNRIVEFLVRVNDISFSGIRSLVEFDFRHPGLDKALFKKKIYSNNKVQFTPKESSIILLIQNGFKSSEIADQLKISKHTVSTHRKNIMKKANCHSVQELIHFCKKNGILHH